SAPMEICTVSVRGFCCRLLFDLATGEFAGEQHCVLLGDCFHFFGGCNADCVGVLDGRSPLWKAERKKAVCHNGTGKTAVYGFYRRIGAYADSGVDNCRKAELGRHAAAWSLESLAFAAVAFVRGAFRNSGPAH
ncbi:MAG: hypothetical protein IJP04_08255, partial [Clostridia bacterium]|nr:hypothetical protein [Clostridia bacterium]